jgi:hypothetical protein
MNFASLLMKTRGHQARVHPIWNRGWDDDYEDFQAKLVVPPPPTTMVQPMSRRLTTPRLPGRTITLHPSDEALLDRLIREYHDKLNPKPTTINTATRNPKIRLILDGRVSHWYYDDVV